MMWQSFMSSRWKGLVGNLMGN